MNFSRLILTVTVCESPCLTDVAPGAVTVSFLPPSPSPLFVSPFLQPEPPTTILLDEPELGLHPYALGTLAALIKSTSVRCQIVVATQSPTLLDEFEPQDVVLVDRQGHESIFSRPDPRKLQAWLEEYRLGEVWWKNVIGGGPGHA